ncbi:hypothetical protein, partial [uncultured Roseibium sp.]|uniref:hypothetical protein n=1 Tax=uncultured Roseibium sp. TaxID=1936171 RepID=UPI00262CA4DC
TAFTKLLKRDSEAQVGHKLDFCNNAMCCPDYYSVGMRLKSVVAKIFFQPFFLQFGHEIGNFALLAF